MNVEENTSNNKPLVVIVGPTASGKSAVGMAIARQYGGEIICADSRTIYKGMDIGTAKPTAEDQREVPHWGLDLVEPGERFTAADFKQYTLQKIDEIRSRGNLPLLVGGTGLYVDGVLFDYQFGAPNLALRKELEGWSIEDLQEYCRKNNIPLPENSTNRRHLQRRIEQGAMNTNRRQSPLDNTIIVGITTETEVLRKRIAQRAEVFFENGMIEEAVRLSARYGWDSEAMTGNAYPLMKRFLQKEISREELERMFSTADWHLAKRQRTWLKRNPFIVWKPLDEAERYISEQLRATIDTKKP